jgi:hypothetical protein
VVAGEPLGEPRVPAGPVAYGAARANGSSRGAGSTERSTIQRGGNDHLPPSEPAAEPPGHAGPVTACAGVGVLAAQRVDTCADEDDHRRERDGPGGNAVEYEQTEDRKDCAKSEPQPRVATLRRHTLTLRLNEPAGKGPSGSGTPRYR